MGVKVAQHTFLTHLFFVDDVLLFGIGTMEEWQHFKSLLDLFCLATGVRISDEKSTFLYNDIDESCRARIFSLLPYIMEPLEMVYQKV